MIASSYEEHACPRCSSIIILSTQTYVRSRKLIARHQALAQLQVRRFIELVHYNLCSPVSSPPEYLPDDDSLHLASLKVDMTLEIHHNMTNILA
ncbi:hypothetical protein NC651_001693 [Populus alba x Populus x berolinensis]|nr:hypothetical protein NC651_001693 [Populus alba x Populus x berolinensis]